MLAFAMSAHHARNENLAAARNDQATLTNHDASVSVGTVADWVGEERAARAETAERRLAEQRSATRAPRTLVRDRESQPCRPGASDAPLRIDRALRGRNNLVGEVAHESVCRPGSFLV